jgi:hypothetical protein
VPIWNKVRPPVPPTPVIVTAVVLALKADAPVEELEIVVIKPLSDATGPEKVVLLMMIPHMRVEVFCLHVVGPEPSEHRKVRVLAIMAHAPEKQKGPKGPF